MSLALFNITSSNTYLQYLTQIPDDSEAKIPNAHDYPIPIIHQPFLYNQLSLVYFFIFTLSSLFTFICVLFISYRYYSHSISVNATPKGR